jgi:hypothetical protein
MSVTYIAFIILLMIESNVFVCSPSPLYEYLQFVQISMHTFASGHEGVSLKKSTMQNRHIVKVKEGVKG